MSKHKYISRSALRPQMWKCIKGECVIFSLLLYASLYYSPTIDVSDCPFIPLMLYSLSPGVSHSICPYVLYSIYPCMLYSIRLCMFYSICFSVMLSLSLYAIFHLSLLFKTKISKVMGQCLRCLKFRKCQFLLVLFFKLKKLKS